MSRLSWLLPPALTADPKDVLCWVRRLEIVVGIVALMLSIVLWGEGWWHWALIAAGVLGLSPWPGARAILRKAERNPGILVGDPARRRARGRRAVMLLVPMYLLLGVGVGYVVDGWPAAISMGALIGGSGALGGWFYLRRTAGN